MNNWGAVLKRKIEERGLKQVEVAQKVGVTQSNISQLVTKAYPPLDILEKICIECLKIELWQFFAPDDLVIPDLNERERTWSLLYKELPDDLRDTTIQVVNATLTSYYLGSKNK